jgi:hypothetical protein
MLFASVTCLIACKKPPKNVQEISNPTSPLLNMLMTKVDFSGNWQWEISSILQREITPTVKNNGQIEEASYGLWGFYNRNQSYATIDHTLETYASSAPIPEKLDLKVDMNMPKGEVLTPTLPLLGTETMAQCVLDPGISEQDHRAACRVVVRYENLISTFAFSSVGKMDKETIESILNEVLVKIDKRIHGFKQ